jgi:hypothetical protein
VRQYRKSYYLVQDFFRKISFETKQKELPSLTLNSIFFNHYFWLKLGKKITLPPVTAPVVRV